jgi:hypothetical protein
MAELGKPRVILLLGSAPDVVRCQPWPKHAFNKIVAINNAWRVRPDWDFCPCRHRRTAPTGDSAGRDRQRLAHVPARTARRLVYAGATMALTAAY